MLETIPFRGWPHALRITNGDAELVATLDVGPRVLWYSLAGGKSPLNIYDDQAGGVGETQWRNRGGHRLWLAPESPSFSYHPDNAPVAWEPIGTTGARLTPPAESTTGFQKQIDLVLAASGAGVTVTHRLKRVAGAPVQVAPWALSVMAAGGRAIIPQPAFGEHPRDLLPNRRLVLWPYTDLADPRYRFGRRFFTLRQQTGAGATKIGLALKEGWAGYQWEGLLFTKRFSWTAGAAFPDDGCNCEVFTNTRMLELESVGPLGTLAAGESCEWTESWNLHGGLPPIGPDADAELGALADALGYGVSQK